METVVQGNSSFQMHPMKGAMTTQTLKGLQGLAPYHWRGDHANFQAFNPAFTQLMGGPQLSTEDMNLYTAFVNSILFMPNPNENLNRTYPTSLSGGNAVTGQTDFMTLQLTTINTTPQTCNACHLETNGAPGTNLLIAPAGAPNSNDPQPLKNPQLRNIYQKQLRNAQGYKGGVSVIDGFGLDHDGYVSGNQGFFTASIFSLYSAQETLDMSAFMLSFDTGTAPAVGYTRTMTSAMVTNSTVQSEWATLQSQAAAGSCDLIANGTLNGVVSGLLYQPSSQNYISNTGSTYTRAQLQTLIQKGDTLSFMGVYPGTGTATVTTIAKGHPVAMKPAPMNPFRAVLELLARL
jgi:hypothetical protein